MMSNGFTYWNVIPYIGILWKNLLCYLLYLCQHHWVVAVYSKKWNKILLYNWLIIERVFIQKVNIFNMSGRPKQDGGNVSKKSKKKDPRPTSSNDEKKKSPPHSNRRKQNKDRFAEPSGLHALRIVKGQVGNCKVCGETQSIFCFGCGVYLCIRPKDCEGRWDHQNEQIKTQRRKRHSTSNT